MVVERPDSLRAAREIAKIDSPFQREQLIAGIVSGDLSTAQVRAQVAETVAPARPTKQDTHSIVERDTRTIHAILARWRSLLDQGDGAKSLIDTRIEELLRELQDLVEAIGQ